MSFGFYMTSLSLRINPSDDRNYPEFRVVPAIVPLSAVSEIGTGTGTGISILENVPVSKIICNLAKGPS